VVAGGGARLQRGPAGRQARVVWPAHEHLVSAARLLLTGFLLRHAGQCLCRCSMPGRI
jgi:hypothetical protein